MIIFTQNYWGKRYKIKNRNINQKRYRYDTCSPSKKLKYYPSTIILKHVDFLDKVNKSPYVNLLNTTPHDDYSITICVRTITISDISHEQKK